MKSLLHELQNNEAVLLMYLANELPAQDREEVEHMLKRDDKLRLELAEIEAGYAGYHITMRRMDAAMPPVSAFMAARALGDVVRARQVDAISLDEHENGRRRIHWVVYPIAAAAAIALGMFIWWDSTVDELKGPVMVTNDHPFDHSYFGHPISPDADLASVPDGRILRMFDPIVSDRGFESQRQLSAIDYLNQSLQ